jgi:WD40 repeat protein
VAAESRAEHPGREVGVWEVETGARRLTLRHDGEAYTRACWGHGRIAAAATTGVVRFWDAETGEEAGAVQAGRSRPFALALSPDGRRVACGYEDGAISLGRPEGGEPLALKGHTGAVNSLCFGADGRYVVSGGSDKTVRVWDGETGAELLLLRGHSGPIQSVSLSPDGKRLASASAWPQAPGGMSELRVWEDLDLRIEKRRREGGR